MFVRETVPADLPGVMNVLDGAALEVDHDRVRASVGRGQTSAGPHDAERRVDGARETLVAVEDDDGDGAILGALVLDGDRVEAVAVRRRRRDQGIGTALVEAATDRRDRLVAGFDADVRPFYERLGFAVEPAGESDRCRGVWTRS